MELATRFSRLAREVGRAHAEAARIELLVAADVEPAALADLFAHGDSDERAHQPCPPARVTRHKTPVPLSGAAPLSLIVRMPKSTM